MKSVLVFQGLAAVALAQTYSATYSPSDAPDTTEEGQTGTNKCGTGSSQTSMCQNAYLNSVDDFCLFAPPEPGAGSTIGETERIEVAWCMKSGTGARLIPDGTMQGVHFVQTPDYIQVTGVGDLTKLNIPKGDAGGELDPHGADGNGNPIGGLVFSNAFGPMEQLHEWTNFMSDSEFCFRGCKEGKNAPALCQHIYDEMGCMWNMPASYDAGVFEQCTGDTGEPMGVYGTSTFHQGDPSTPNAHPAPSSSQCSKVATISNGAASSGGSSTMTSGVSASTTVSTDSTTSTQSSAPSTPTSTSAGSISGSATLATHTSSTGSGISSTSSAVGSGSASSTTNAALGQYGAISAKCSRAIATFVVAALSSILGCILIT